MSHKVNYIKLKIGWSIKIKDGNNGNFGTN